MPDMMTEQEKMVAGLAYDGLDSDLEVLRHRGELLQAKFNATLPGDPGRQAILLELCPGAKEDTFFRGPVFFDYGCFTTFGSRFYANYNCTILDVAPVTIGDNVLFGPNVSLLTPSHPIDYRDRYPSPGVGCEFARPIHIGNDVWLGGGVIVLGGVTIGDGAVIGAGSVVTHDIPPGVVAVGNPCRVLRPIGEKDRMRNHPELFDYK